MRGPERGFLLLTSVLGDPGRKKLTTAQMRVLAERAWQLDITDEERDLTEEDFLSLGYGRPMAQRIVSLLSQEDVLDHYLSRARRSGCVPLTRISEGYPLQIRRKLELDSPGVIWAKGDLSILNTPMISLVGSRDLNPENQQFAEEAGRQAAIQGFTLVSGNARGADRTAQESCLRHGGKVISVVADELEKHSEKENVLYLSEEDFDAPFSAQRALSRNRLIHAMSDKTLVCQCSLGTGGSWDGTVKNLRFGWSRVFCFADGSEATAQLEQMGAEQITSAQLSDFQTLQTKQPSFFD